MNKMYEKIKRYYDSGLWSKERVLNVYLRGVITEDEYKDIVGEQSDMMDYGFAEG